MKRALVRSGVIYFFLISTMGETERMDIQIKIQGK